MDVQEARQAEETVPSGKGLRVNIQVHGGCRLGRTWESSSQYRAHGMMGGSVVHPEGLSCQLLSQGLLR